MFKEGRDFPKKMNSSLLGNLSIALLIISAYTEKLFQKMGTTLN